MINHRSYHRAKFFSSSNSVVAGLYNAENSVVEFFKLKSVNETLSEENTRLKNQIIVLDNQLSLLHPQNNDSVQYPLSPENEYRFIAAKVINNSTHRMQNYITLNKGSRDGLKTNMGVINEQGVVGIVTATSERFAVVTSLLNNKLAISCRFTSNHYSGTARWTGFDARYTTLEDIARHVEFSKTDSLVTSGYSSSFPEGIPVGQIHDFSIAQSDAYYKIVLKLAVNFKTLSYVKIIDYKNQNEQNNLENSAQTQ
jgi:rod shape-determining protein MreC